MHAAGRRRYDGRAGDRCFEDLACPRRDARTHEVAPDTTIVAQTARTPIYDSVLQLPVVSPQEHRGRAIFLAPSFERFSASRTKHIARRRRIFQPETRRDREADSAVTARRLTAANIREGARQAVSLQPSGCAQREKRAEFMIACSTCQRRRCGRANENTKKFSSGVATSRGVIVERVTTAPGI